MKTRILYTRIWQDGWFASLKPEEKTVYLYLLTNEKVNSVFLYEVSARDVSYCTGLDDIDAAEAILQSFEKKEKIQRHCGYIFLTNALKYENYKGYKNAVSKIGTLELLGDHIITHFKEYIEKILGEIDDEIADSVTPNAYKQVIDRMRIFRKRLGQETKPKKPKKAPVTTTEVSSEVLVPDATHNWADMTPAEQMVAFINNDVCNFGIEVTNAQDMVLRWIRANWKVSNEIAQAELLKFLNHWTEPTKSGKKMLWETKATFEVKRRLTTWMGNAEKWGNNKNEGAKYAAASV